MKTFTTVIAACSVALLLSFSAPVSGASLSLMRKWVVFPFESEPGQKFAAEQAWWKSRELLTESKKYLVASRQFLTDKEVFQPRKKLSSEDIKTLAELLDADVFVTGVQEKKQFTLTVYLTQNQSLFWTKHLPFHPGLNAGDQFELTSERLTRELLASIPYQGFSIVDPLIGKSIFTEGEKSFSLIDIGTAADVAPGNEVQFITVELPENQKEGTSVLEGSRDVILAEGVIAKLKKGGVVSVEVLRTRDENIISDKTLVRIPVVSEKMAKTFSTRDSIFQKLSPELIPENIPPVASENKKHHKPGVIIGTILSFLGIIALAL